MAGLDDVLERLVTDPAFGRRLASDPTAALAGYELSADDLTLLASQVSNAAGASGTVDRRTSKASLAGFMGAAGDLAEAFGVSGEEAADHTDDTKPSYSAVVFQKGPSGATDASPDDLAGTADAALGEDHIEIHSWAPSQPAPAEPALIDEEVGFVYGTIDFVYNEPGNTSPEDLSGRADATQDTGPIADVLYSAAGNSSDSNPGMPVVGDWDGDDDALLGDHDTDGADFLAWQRDPVEPNDTAPSGELAGIGGSSEQESVSFTFEKTPITYDPAAGSDNEPGVGEDIATVDPEIEQGMSWQLQDAMISSYQMGGTSEGPVGDGTAEVLVGAGGLDHGSASADVADQAPGSSDGTVSVGGVEYYFFDNTAIAEPEADAVSAEPQEPTARGGDAIAAAEALREPSPAPDPEPTNEPAAASTAEAPKAEAPRAETKQIEQPPEPPVEERVEAAAEPPAAPAEPEEPAAEAAPAS
jgi:hypothetical protein